jgi:hypothetical protein
MTGGTPNAGWFFSNVFCKAGAEENNTLGRFLGGFGFRDRSLIVPLYLVALTVASRLVLLITKNTDSILWGRPTCTVCFTIGANEKMPPFYRSGWERGERTADLFIPIQETRLFYRHACIRKISLIVQIQRICRSATIASLQNRRAWLVIRVFSMGLCK